jgi:hypothetical protein
MSRRPSFRRDRELQDEVRRINKLVQNKQSRLRRQEGLEVTNVATNKYKEFNSRKEINKYLTEMNAFLHNKKDFKVENVHGVEINYSEIKEVEKAVRKTNRQKEKLWDNIKDLPFKHRGVPTGLTLAQRKDPILGMGDVRFADLEPVKFNVHSVFTQRDWEKKKTKLLKLYGEGNYLQKLNELYKENYITAMQNALGDDSKKLQQHIKSMSLEDFMRETFSENNADINFVYDRLAIKTRVQELERIWGLAA